MPVEFMVSAQKQREALELSNDLLTDLELSRIPLALIALKTSRLARILNQDDEREMFRYEANGYPTTTTGVSPEIWRLATLAGRTYEQKQKKDGVAQTVAYLESIEQLENQIDSSKVGLKAAQDRAVSISSANPSQYVWAPGGNYLERKGLLEHIAQSSKRMASRRTLIYDYVSRINIELKYSGIAQDIFAEIRRTTDKTIAKIVPSAIEKFVSVHENLRSENPEDWSNAVHSCRRILQDLADVLYPPQSKPKVIQCGGKIKEVKLGADQYINRLIEYVLTNSKSERFEQIVGSHIKFLGDRLDAIFLAAQKGSHASVGLSEANRYVIYTYMMIGDLLTLKSAAQ